MSHGSFRESLARVLSTEQGRRVLDEAKRLSHQERTRQQIDDLARRVLRKEGAPAATGGRDRD